MNLTNKMIISPPHVLFEQETIGVEITRGAFYCYTRAMKSLGYTLPEAILTKIKNEGFLSIFEAESDSDSDTEPYTYLSELKFDLVSGGANQHVIKKQRIEFRQPVTKKRKMNEVDPRYTALKEKVKDLFKRVRANDANLVRLILRKFDLGDAGAELLAEEMEKNTTIQGINLTDNNIGYAGAEALSTMLHKNTTIQSINLTDNNIGDAGAEALSTMLHKNTTVEFLYLTNNNIGDAGAKALAEAMQYNTTVEYLNLFNNNISDAGSEALAEALAGNDDLKLKLLVGVNLNNFTEAMGINNSFQSKDNFDILKYLRETAKERNSEESLDKLTPGIFVRSTIEEQPSPSPPEQQCNKKNPSINSSIFKSKPDNFLIYG